MLIGRIGKKEMKTMKNGGHMTVVSLATNKKFIDSKGIQQENTIWHWVNFYEKLAEIVNQHAHVGQLVYIEGEIYNKRIEKDGKTTTAFHSIQGEKIQFLPSPKREDSPPKHDDIPYDDSIPY